MGQCSSKQGQSPSSSSSSQAVMIDAPLPISGSRRRRGSSSKQSSKRVAAADEKVVKRNIGSAINHKQPRLVTTCEDDSQSSSSSSNGGSGMTQSPTLTSSITDGQSSRSRVVIDRKRALPRQSNSSPTSQSSPSPQSSNYSSHQYQKQQPSPPQNKLPRSFDETYQILPLKLGHGIAGQVHQCIHCPTAQICAVKTINKSRTRRKDRIKREIAFLRQVRHPNIIRMYDTYEDEHNVHIITEMCRGGELFDKIVEKAKASKNISIMNDGTENRRPACFREGDAARIIHQLLSAVSYLHSNDIIHRDLKPENILFVEKDNDESPIKLIDFGLSIRHTKHCQPLANIVGTSYYMAPELLEGSYTRSCDLWSVGVVAYVLLSGRPPFNGSSDDVIFKKIKRGQYKMNSRFFDDGVSEYAKDFIRCLLDIDPSRRWTADMALHHAWLKLARLEDNAGFLGR